MNLNNRIKRLEKAVIKKHAKNGLNIVEEYEGKYFIEKDGQYLEIDKPVDDDPNKMLIILKIYSDPREHYEMQKNIE